MIVVTPLQSLKSPLVQPEKATKYPSVKCKRTLETAIETMYRKDRNRTNMAKKRALESPIETMFRLVSQATPSNHCEIAVIRGCGLRDYV